MAKPEAVKLEPPKAEPKPIQMNELKLRESCNANWTLEIRDGKRPEQLEDNALWTIVRDKVRAFDLVHAVAKDFFAEYLIVSAERGFAPIVKMLRAVEFTSLPENQHNDLPPGYRIDFDNLTSTYRAFRERDNIPMTPSLPSREDVRRQLVTHASLR